MGNIEKIVKAINLKLIKRVGRNQFFILWTNKKILVNESELIECLEYLPEFKEVSFF